ncbi:g3376 [Coccomyxa viridis]|uniref:G3376 protein n=1 Tax=Coccomyxa viridis TaxID=1274662 RepID=A0ABP1FR29_9CHLO
MALKVQLKDLALRRESIEGDIALRSERLEASGVGRTGSLVDKEGFPRADIDVAAVRVDRQRIAELTNDHKALTKAMDGLLQQLHALQKSHSGKIQSNGHTSSKAPALHSIQAAAGNGAAENSAQQIHSRPFARIDEVSMDSPASTAGLQVGDLLLQIGDVSAQSSMPSQETMAQVASLVRRSRDVDLSTVVLRKGLEAERQTLKF